MSEFEYTHEHLEEFTDAVMEKLADKTLRNDVREALLVVMEKHAAQEIIFPDVDYHIVLWYVEWDETKEQEQVFAKVKGQMLIDAGYYTEDGPSYESMKPILDAISKKAGKEITYFDIWDIVEYEEYITSKEYDTTK